MPITYLLFSGITLRNASLVAPDTEASRVSATYVFRLLDRETKIYADLHGNSAPIRYCTGTSGDTGCWKSGNKRVD